jgi:hypothetical protein
MDLLQTTRGTHLYRGDGTGGEEGDGLLQALFIYFLAHIIAYLILVLDLRSIQL